MPGTPSPLWLAALLIAGVSTPLKAEPIRVSGQILASAGKGLAGARVELLPQAGAPPLATVRTDAAGLFELAAPESGCFRVRVQVAGHLSLETRVLAVVEETDLMPAVAIPAAAPRAREAIGNEAIGGWVFSAPAPAAASPPPATPRLVQGTVSDAKGAPVPGALVWSEGSPAAPCVRAGAKGEFQLRLPASGEARLRAAAAGYLPSEPREPALKGADTALRLEPAGSITGQIVDAAGHPLARITLGALPVQWTDERSPLYATAWSREDGRFRLSQLSPGKLYTVTATQEGFAPASVEAGALPRDRHPAPVRIVLERGTVAFGRLLDRENQPVRGAELVLTPPSEGMFSDQMNMAYEETVAQATSNPEGRFELRHLNPGRFQLRVRRKGFAPFAVPEIEIPPRTARVDLGTLTLDRGLAVEGKITDPRGVPLPGAELDLGPAFEPFAVEAKGLDSAQKALTGSDGRFRFDDLRRGAHFDLRIKLQGYAPASVQVEVPAPEPLAIEMKPGRTLSGRVTGPKGEPVQNASLSTREEIAIRLPGGLSKVPTQRPLGVTDGEGRFRVEGVAPGKTDLEVNAAGYRFKRLQGFPVPEESNVEGLEISLEKGSVLEIRALDGRGAPVAGALVEARRIDSPGPEARGFFSQCQTDEEGRCGLNDIEAGWYNVAARSERHGRAEATLETKTGVNTRELVLSGGVEVSGRVSDENGAPVPSAGLSLQPAGSGDALTVPGSADGSFRFPAVGDGTFRLSGRAPGFAETSAPGEIQVGGREVRGLDLRLSRGATLTGQVLGLGPEELGSVLIFTFRADGALSRPQSGGVDRQGRYRIDGMGPGAWKVTAQQMEGRGVQEPLQLAPGIREAVLDLQFPTGFTLSGRVLVDRAPAAGAQVVALAGGKSSQAMTGPDGGFRVSNLPADRYDLLVTDLERGLSTAKSVEVTGDQEITVEIRTGGLRGRISSADTGAPVAGALIQMERAVQEIPGMDSIPSRTSDRSGGFETPRIAAGTYRIVVEKEGFASYQADVEVRPGAPAAVAIELKPLP
jgi:protocatechuate 3,4-dioxygenase beta subunit